jgi:hypothetical protein
MYSASSSSIKSPPFPAYRAPLSPAYTIRSHRSHNPQPCHDCADLQYELRSTKLKAESAFTELRKQSEKDLSSLNAKLHAKEASMLLEHKALLEEIERLQFDLTQKTAESQRYKQEIQAIVNTTDLSDTSESAASQYFQLKLEVDRKERQLQDMEDFAQQKHEKYESDKIELLSEISRLKSQNSSLHSTIDDLSQEITRRVSVDDIQQLQSQLEEALNKNLEFSKTLSHKNSLIESLISGKSESEIENHRLQRIISSNIRSHDDEIHAKLKTDLFHKRKMTELDQKLRKSEIHSVSLEQQLTELNNLQESMKTDFLHKLESKRSEINQYKLLYERESMRCNQMVEKFHNERIFYEHLLGKGETQRPQRNRTNSAEL